LAVLKNGHPSWTGQIDWIDEHWEDPLRWTKPRKIFVNSMSDLFHEKVPDLWVDDVFAVMQHCQARGHIFQILTKRPKRMLEYFNNPDLYLRLMDRVNYVRGRWPKIPVTAFSDPKTFPLRNVWLGVSTEDQRAADERIPLLAQCPAAVRFISAEPLIGPIDLEWPKTFYPDGPRMCCSGLDCGCHGLPVDLPLWYGLHLVIAGGESGTHAHPCNVDWISSIVSQCKQWNVPVFVKQLGSHVIQGGERRIKKDSKGGDMSEWPHEIRIRQFPKEAQL
jgi:protein gp37